MVDYPSVFFEDARPYRDGWPFFFVWYMLAGLDSGIFYYSEILPTLKGGEKIDFGKFTPQRIAGSAVQALPQEGCEKRHPQHCTPQALVRLEERATPHQ